MSEKVSERHHRRKTDLVIDHAWRRERIGFEVNARSRTEIQYVS